MSETERLEKGKRTLQKLHGGPLVSNLDEAFSPGFEKLSQGHLFSEVWPRENLPLRERTVINVAVLCALRYDFGLANTIRWAFNVGISKDEVLEIIIMVAHYAGWPTAVNGNIVAREVFANVQLDEKQNTGTLKQPEENPDAGDSARLEKGQELISRVRGHVDWGKDVEEVFPDFWKMTQEYFWGEIWARPGLAFRDRLIIDIAMLSLFRYDQELASSIRGALRNGISREEILEILMQIAHYRGWQAGVQAILIAKKVFAE